MCIKLSQNSSVWKDTIRIPKFIKIGQEFQRFEGYPVMQGSQEEKHGNLWGVHTRFGTNKPMKKGPEYQCLKGLGQNSNNYKNSARIKMFRRIRSEFQCS